MGLSLGMDLLSPKTCSYDCLFCEVGRTTCLTIERREYAPAAEVLEELDRWLAAGGKANFITLAGSGEPTLHSRVGFLLTAIRKRCRIKSAILTNGSLLYLPEVRKDCLAADLVKVSLSAWDDASFRRINRPFKDLSFEDIVWGLGAFRAEYKGELWLEVFVLAGINDDERAIGHIAALARGFKPDKIHLNTVARPPAEESAVAVDAGKLEKLASLFQGKTEVVAGFSTSICCEGTISEEDVLAMLRRRPCTVRDVANAFRVSESLCSTVILALADRGQLVREERDSSVYYGVRRGF